MRNWAKIPTHFMAFAFDACAAVTGAAFLVVGFIVAECGWEEVLGEGEPGGAGEADMTRSCWGSWRALVLVFGTALALTVVPPSR